MGCSALLWGLLRAHPRARDLAGVCSASQRDTHGETSTPRQRAAARRCAWLVGKRAGRAQRVCALRSSPDRCREGMQARASGGSGVSCFSFSSCKAVKLKGVRRTLAGCTAAVPSS